MILHWAVLTRGNPVTVRAPLPGLDKLHVLKASEAGNHTRKCGGTSLEPERCREVACGSAGWEGHCYQGDSTCLTLCLLARLAAWALEKACTDHAQIHDCCGTCPSGFPGLRWALAPSACKLPSGEAEQAQPRCGHELRASDTSLELCAEWRPLYPRGREGLEKASLTDHTPEVRLYLVVPAQALDPHCLGRHPNWTTHCSVIVEKFLTLFCLCV